MQYSFSPKVTISKEPVDIRINQMGIVVSMIDNQYGILQFPSGQDCESGHLSQQLYSVFVKHVTGSSSEVSPSEGGQGTAQFILEVIEHALAKPAKK